MLNATAEKIRADVAALRVSAGSGEWRGSVSVGVAVRTADMTGMDELLRAADEGVYAAKHKGRNCVAMAAMGDPNASIPAL